MKEMNWISTTKDCLIAVGFAALGTMMCCMILAWTVSQEWVPITLCLKVAPVLMSACLFGGCCFSASRASRQKLPVACLTAGLMMVLLLIITLLFFGEKNFVMDWRWILPLLAAVGAGLMVSGPKKRRR